MALTAHYNTLEHEGWSEDQVSRPHTNVGRKCRARIFPSASGGHRVEGGGGRAEQPGPWTMPDVCYLLPSPTLPDTADLDCRMEQRIATERRDVVKFSTIGREGKNW